MSVPGLNFANPVSQSSGLPVAYLEYVDPSGVTCQIYFNADIVLEDLLAGSGRCQLLYATSDWLAALNAGGVETLQAKLATGTQAQLSTYGLE